MDEWEERERLPGRWSAAMAGSEGGSGTPGRRGRDLDEDGNATETTTTKGRGEGRWYIGI